jgi:hypothetical protein
VLVAVADTIAAGGPAAVGSRTSQLNRWRDEIHNTEHAVIGIIIGSRPCTPAVTASQRAPAA